MYFMAKPSQIIVKESIKELRLLQRKHGELIGKRLHFLIETKKSESTGGLSKRYLSDKLGVNHNSILRWRKLYLQSGIDGILQHGRTGFKPSVISKEEHAKLEQKLNDPENGLRGYVELLQWAENEFSKEIKYTTLLEYCKRKFGTKIKVARKSHIKKDIEAVNNFKKTLVKK